MWFTPSGKNTSFTRIAYRSFLHSWQHGWQERMFPGERGAEPAVVGARSGPTRHHMCPTSLSLSLCVCVCVCFYYALDKAH